MAITIFNDFFRPLLFISYQPSFHLTLHPTLYVSLSLYSYFFLVNFFLSIVDFETQQVV